MGLVKKTFSELITFTRSTGGGRFNAQGQYEWLPANEPRIDYDPVTGECLGLLVEEQRTNLLTYSNEFGNAAWAKTRTTVKTGPVLAPDGTGQAWLLSANTENATHFVSQSRSFTAGANTVSVFMRDGGKGTGYLRAYDGTTFFGALFSVESMTASNLLNCTATVTPARDGWVRCTITFTAAAGSGTVYVYPEDAGARVGDGTSGIYIWGAQLEAGAFPTSYIPTAGAQVTRAADIASVNELSPWYNPEAGTLFVDMVAIGNRAVGGTFALSVGASSAEYLGLAYVSASAGGRGVYAAADGANASVVPPGPLAAGARVKIAASYTADGTISSAADGTFSGSKTLTSGRAPAFASMYIGRGHFGGAAVNCHIRSIRYFPRRLSNSELQALTA